MKKLILILLVLALALAVAYATDAARSGTEAAALFPLR